MCFVVFLFTLPSRWQTKISGHVSGSWSFSLSYLASQVWEGYTFRICRKRQILNICKFSNIATRAIKRTKTCCICVYVCAGGGGFSGISKRLCYFYILLPLGYPMLPLSPSADKISPFTMQLISCLQQKGFGIRKRCQQMLKNVELFSSLPL